MLDNKRTEEKEVGGVRWCHLHRYESKATGSQARQKT